MKSNTINNALRWLARRVPDYASRTNKNFRTTLSTSKTTVLSNASKSGILYINFNRGNEAGYTVSVAIDGNVAWHYPAYQVADAVTVNFQIEKGQTVTAYSDGGSWTLVNTSWVPFK